MLLLLLLLRRLRANRQRLNEGKVKGPVALGIGESRIKLTILNRIGEVSPMGGGGGGGGGERERERNLIWQFHVQQANANFSGLLYDILCQYYSVYFT